MEYTNTHIIVLYCRRSVHIEQKDVPLKKPLGTEEYTNGSMEGARGTEESTNGTLGSMEGAHGTKESTESNQGSMEGAQWSAEAKHRKMYTLTPVDRYGDTVEGATPLEDKGQPLLSVQYFNM